MDIEKETSVLSDIAKFFGLKKKDIVPTKVVAKSTHKDKKSKKTKKAKKAKKPVVLPKPKRTIKYSKDGNDYTETIVYPEETVKFPFKKPTDMKGVHYTEIDHYSTTEPAPPKKSRKLTPVKIVHKKKKAKAPASDYYEVFLADKKPKTLPKLKSIPQPKQ